MNVAGRRSRTTPWSLSIAVAAAVVATTVSLSQWNAAGLEFSDPALEQLVLEKAEREAGELRRTDVLRITHIDGAGRGITDLNGIAALRRLESLRLPRNGIEDVSPLAELPRLVELDLSGNGLADLDGAGFGALGDGRIRELRLRSNGITDLGPIDRMSALTRLDLRDNHLRDIGGLASLHRLEHLNLRENEVQDITPIGVLQDLTYLNLHSNFQAGGLESLRLLTHLEELILRGVPTEDPGELLADLSRLRRLNLRETGAWTLPKVERIVRRAADAGDAAGPRPWVDLRGNPVLASLSQDALDQIERSAQLVGAVLPEVLPPAFSISRGHHPEPFDLEFSTIYGGEVIYTLDGSDPDLDTNADQTHRFRAPIRIVGRDSSGHPFTEVGLRYGGLPYNTSPDLPAATVVTARTVVGERVSAPITHTYFVGEDVFARYGVRVISLSGDPEGFFGSEDGILVAGQIYDDLASEWEKRHPDDRASGAPGNFNQRGRIRLNLEGIEVVDYGNGLVSIPYADHGVSLSFDLRGSVARVTISGTTFYDDIFYLDPSSTTDQLVFAAPFVPMEFGPSAAATADWERPVRLEVFGPTGSATHVSGAGVRIHGDDSRAASAKSLRLYLRGEYGTRRLQTSVFDEGDLAHRRLLLRRALHRSGLEDVMAQELMRRLDPDAHIQRYAPAVLFLNGDLLGPYNIRDRYDRWYLAGVHNVDPSTIALLGGSNTPIYGSEDLGEPFKQLEEFIRTADLASSEALKVIEDQMDIDNYIAYMVNGIFLNYHDWGVEKHRRVWRSLENRFDVHPSLDGRWRWLPLDLDLTFHARSSVEADYLRTIASDRRYMLPYLLENPEFSDRFHRRFVTALEDTYSPTNTLPLLEQLAGEISVADREELYGRPPGWWEQHVDAMRTFLNERPSMLQAHLDDFFRNHS